MASARQSHKDFGEFIILVYRRTAFPYCGMIDMVSTLPERTNRTKRKVCAYSEPKENGSGWSSRIAASRERVLRSVREMSGERSSCFLKRQKDIVCSACRHSCQVQLDGCQGRRFGRGANFTPILREIGCFQNNIGPVI